MTFATTWMNLKSIMINEISQTEKYKYYMTSLVSESQKKEKSQLIETEGKSGCQGLGGGGGENKEKIVKGYGCSVIR